MYFLSGKEEREQEGEREKKKEREWYILLSSTVDIRPMHDPLYLVISTLFMCYTSPTLEIH